MSISRPIPDIHPDKITSPELAVDREIAEDEVSHIAVKFKTGPGRPDLPRFLSRRIQKVSRSIAHIYNLTVDAGEHQGECAKGLADLQPRE